VLANMLLTSTSQLYNRVSQGHRLKRPSSCPPSMCLSPPPPPPPPLPPLLCLGGGLKGSDAAAGGLQGA